MRARSGGPSPRKYERRLDVRRPSGSDRRNDARRTARTRSSRPAQRHVTMSTLAVCVPSGRGPIRFLRLHGSQQPARHRDRLRLCRPVRSIHLGDRTRRLPTGQIGLSRQTSDRLIQQSRCCHRHCAVDQAHAVRALRSSVRSQRDERTACPDQAGTASEPRCIRRHRPARDQQAEDDRQRQDNRQVGEQEQKIRLPMMDELAPCS